MKLPIYSFVTIFFCILMQANALGQDIEEETPFVGHRYAAKFSPFSLLPFPIASLQFGFEHKLKNQRHAFHHEIGALLPFPYYLNDGDFQGMGGFRAVSAYRYYINKPTTRFNFFTSSQYRLQYESWTLNDWFDRHDGSYRQLYNYKKKVMSHGFVATIGGNKKARYSNFFFEWEMGFGVKSRTTFNRGVPSDATISEFNGAFFPLLDRIFTPTSAENEETIILPIILAAIRFGVVIP